MMIYIKQLALVILILTGLFNHAQASEIRYSHEDCEYGVRFPVVPTTQTVYIPSGKSFEQAKLFDNNYFLRAECIKIDPLVSLKQEDFENFARKFSADQGLGNAEYRIISGPLGKEVIGRGTKKISSRPITYEYHCTFGNKSIICLLGGAPADTYPLEIITNFFKSLSLNVNQTDPNWTFIGIESKGRKLYVESRSLVRDGRIVRVAVLLDLVILETMPQGKPGWSKKVITEFDCQGRSYRSVGMQLFSLHMAAGELVGVNDSISNWTPMSSTTLNDILIKNVCLNKQM